MTPGPASRRFAFAYGAAFAILYVLARARGLALFTVYPSLGIILPGMHRSRDVADPAIEFLAPEMWWYGWTATAALGALAWLAFWPRRSPSELGSGSGLNRCGCCR
jgi:hypothetical protein